MTATDPRVLFLTSCHPGDTLQLSGWSLNVTVGGTAIRSIRSPTTNYTQFPCAQVQVWSDSNVTCTLPTLADFPALASYLQYNLTLYRAVGGPEEFTSNYFAVTFGDAAAPAADAEGKGTKRW